MFAGATFIWDGWNPFAGIDSFKFSVLKVLTSSHIKA